MTNSPPSQPTGRMPGGGRQSSFSGPTFASLDPRNHRIDTIIGAQAHQPSSNSSGFDTSSPVSLDFNYPFGGSPHGSGNSPAIDAPPELRMQNHGQYSGRGSMSDASRGPVQHRHSLASIDSAFDHDMLTSGALSNWNAAHHGHHQTVSNPDDSPKANEADNNDSSEQKAKSDQDDNRPAWSELKTKAGKERKRLPLACIACRRKKIRCSGEKPACKHCLRARVPCVYKVTTRKAAPRTDYMAMLDKRLKRMEDRVIKVIPKEELPDLTVTGRASVKPPIPGASATAAASSSGVKQQKDPPPGTKKRSATEAFTHELSSWTGPNRASTTVPPPSTTLPTTAENKLFLEGADALPPQSLQEHLAEVFFTSLYGQSYLLLHKPSFLRKLRAGTVPPVLILAVCAISARFSTHPALATEPAFLRGEQWATPARRICERRHYEPNITVLISMVLLGLHYFGTCEGGLSWGFGGMAMRMGYALQLHRELEREPTSLRPSTSSAATSGDGAGQAGAQAGSTNTHTSTGNTNATTNMHSNSNFNNTSTGTKTTKPSTATSNLPELSFTDREIRRRTMWACYLMDTFNSSGTERPSFLSEDYFSIQLPIKESHFQMEIPGPTEDLHGDVPLLQQRQRAPQAQQAQHRRGNTNSQAKDPLALSAEAATIAAEAKSNMGVAAYVIRSVVLWKRIVKYLNLGGKARDPHPIWDSMSEFASLARQITSLRSSLPDDLRYDADNLAAHASTRLANQFLLLHIMLAQSSLFLHRFAIPTYPSSRPHHAPLLASGMPKTFLTSSAQTVIDAAAAISALLAESAGHTLTVPFAGYCAYASATVHVWGIFSRLPSLEASSKENLRVNYRYLTRMKRYWGMFHYMAESVKETYRGFADASAKYAAGTTSAAAALLRSQSFEGGRGSASPSLESGVVGGGSRSNTPGHTPSHSASSAGGVAGAARQMFQYGDWFDKYPHGVSESEWESSHLEYRKDGAGGADAVMSQRSELQSVEEFFASLSPPSKADEAAAGGGRNKKAPRRRGKSMAETSSAEGAVAGNKGAVPAAHRMQGQPTQQQQQRASISIPSDAQRPGIQRQGSGLSLSTNFPGAADPFDLTSPNLYGSAQMSAQPQSATDPFGSGFSPPGSGHPGAPPYGYHFNQVVPNLDRQMVFGAYAGMDPSQITSSASVPAAATTSPNSGFPQWDQSGLDVNGNFNGGFDGMSGSGFTGGMGGTAWFMPFNMEPPNFGAMGGDELGGGALDGMDFNFSPDLGGDAGTGDRHQRVSFSAQGGPRAGGGANG